MRAFLAATMLCLFACALSSQADAHARYRYWHHRHVVHNTVHRVAAHAPGAATQHYARHVGRAAPPISARLPFWSAFAGLFGNAAQTVGNDISGIYQRVTNAAIEAGVPVSIAHAVVRVESNYNVALRGRAGEIGIMQIKPQTAAAMGENPYNVDGNLRAGMKYLRLALNSSNDLCAAVSGYNHGVGRVYCSDYGKKVLAMADAR